MKKTGIIGYGKMGKDIFNQIFRQPDMSDILVYCRHDADVYSAKVKKELDKSFKRGRITAEQYDVKLKNIRFTSSLECFAECDIIIESISENISAKQEIFRKLDAVVNPECIVTTNTSSLNISELFSGFSNPERCMGLHFFYPVQFSTFAEINILSQTGEKQIDQVNEFLSEIKKKGIVFSGNYHIYMNQFINMSISQAILLYDEENIPMNKFQQILSDIFPMHGLFGMIDGIGLDLLAADAMEFACPRIKPLMNYGTNQMKKWLAEGCSGEPNSFFTGFTEQKNAEREFSEAEKEELCLKVLAPLLKEAVCAASEYGGDIHTMFEAIKDTVGFAESLSFYYDRYGYERISQVLDMMYEKSGLECFNPMEKNVFEKCYSC